MQTTDRSTANAGEIAYWNAGAAEKWVHNQAAMDQLMGPATALLMESARVEPGEAVLDVGCGTGASTLQLAVLTGPHGRVIGCDISAPMLEVARRRLAAAQAVHADLLLADAQIHAFPAGGFDAVVSRFGVMFFDDPVAAFANLARALRPGGRLAFVCWAPMQDNPMFQIPLQAAVGRLGPAEPTPPRAPGPLAFSDPDYVRDILAAAAFVDVAVEDRRPPLAGLATAEAQAELSCEMGPAARLIADRQADAATVAAIQAEIAEAFASYLADGRVQVPSRLWYVHARRPPAMTP